MESLNELGKLRQRRRCKMEIGPWPPDDIEKISPFETAKELSDAYEHAKYLPCTNAEERVLKRNLLNTLQYAWKTLGLGWPDGPLQAYENAERAGE